MSNRLVADQYGWLTTIAKSGLPVPRLIWFHFDGSAIYLTMPGAAKVAHIRRHPQVSLNLDSDGNGGGIVVVAGTARVDAEESTPAAIGRTGPSTAPPPSSSG